MYTLKCIYLKINKELKRFYVIRCGSILIIIHFDVKMRLITYIDYIVRIENVTFAFLKCSLNRIAIQFSVILFTLIWKVRLHFSFLN